MFYLRIKNNIDILLAILGLMLGLVATSLYVLSPTTHLISIGLALVLGCVVYLGLNKSSLDINVYKGNACEKRFLDILYFIFFSVSLIIWHISLNRLFSYFIVFSLCSGILSLSIYLSETKIDYYIQYIKIIFLSFNIKYSIYMLAGYVPGVDTYIHAKMIDLLANSGDINVLIGKEMYFPIMHVHTAIMKIICTVTTKDASNFAIIIPYILATTFVFLLARNLYGYKVGLLAMLLVNLSDFHILWGSNPQTTSYGVMLYYSLIYVLFKKIYFPSNPKWGMLSITLIITLIITHAVSSFIFLITVFILYVGPILYNKLYKENRTKMNNGILLISILLIVQQWFMATIQTGVSFFDHIISSLFYYVTGYAGFLNRPEATIEVASALPPLIERFADTFGLSIFLFFAIIGSLISLSSLYKDQIKFSYIFLLLVLFAITFVFPLFGIKNIIPTRWFAFEYFFVSVFAAFAIMQLSRITDRLILKKVFIIFTFFIFAFFMSASTISNLDSPLWLKDSTISTTYNKAEIRGAETLVQYSDNFFSDARYGPSVIGIYLSDVESTSSISYAIRNKEEIYKQQNKIFLWRNYMLDRPIRSFNRIEGYDRIIQEPIILGPETLNELEKTNRIYDNNEIIGFYIMDDFSS
jgi:hypothetical protein